MFPWARTRNILTALFVLLVPCHCALGQQDEPNEKSPNAVQLKVLQDAMGQIEIKSLVGDQPTLRMHAQPLFRWSSAQSFVVDGGVFVWLHEDRPEVIGAIWIKNGSATLELKSLSAERLTATLDGRRIWAPAQPGVEWAVIPDAPAPLTTKAERLRQMKSLAANFATNAVKTAPDYEEGSIWHFRMMPQPIFSYGEASGTRGAIFAFAQGTDPEVYLLIDLRKDRDGNEKWHYAFAPACVWELHGRLNDREVWIRPKNRGTMESSYQVITPVPIPAEILQQSK